ncbi:MAG TPA: TonB-dependent receptor [Sphingobium sp.]|nr:TonB-dependent receptor [Sphingobium sp.]
MAGQRISNASLSAMAVALALSPAIAHAADAQAPAAQASTTPVSANEIIVTAQRRAERLEDVPFAVTAVSGDTLTKSGVTELKDLGQLVVGAQINRSGAFAQPSIRGVTTLTSAFNFENGVALYLDGLYQSDQASLLNDLANISSIQVLKGPQGTLYGRNAMAGAIVIETLAPSDTLTAKADLSYGKLNEIKTRAYISGPLADGISASLSLYRRKNDGYIRDIGADPVSTKDDYDAAPLEQTAINAKLRFEPSDDLNLTLSYNHSISKDARGLVYTVYRFPASFLPKPPFRATEMDTASNNRRAFSKVKVDEISLIAKWDTGIGQLTSITGYGKRSLGDLYDFDGSKAEIFYGGQDQPNNFKKTFQQTLDYAINAIDGLDLVVGGFFYDENSRNKSQNWGGTYPRLQKQSQADYGSRAYAAYIDGTYQLTNQLFLSGGVRYSWEKRTLSYFEIPGLNTVTFPPLTGTSASFDAFTPRASIRYEIGPRTNIYASYSQGFRSGVFDPTPVANPATVTPIKPERIKSYEVGFKTANSRMRFSVAGYYYDFRDLQVGVTVPDPTDPTKVIVKVANAKKAEGYGGEAEMSYSLFDDFNIRAGLAYIHAEYTDFKNATGVGWNAATGFNISNQVQDWSGHQMARAPKWSGNFGADYTAHLDGGSSLNFAVNANFTSSYVVRDPSLWGPSAGAALANKQRYRQKGYAMANVQVNWTDASGHLTVGAYCQNCTDKRYQMILAGGAFGDYRQFNEPRTYGMRVGFQY